MQVMIRRMQAYSLPEIITELRDNAQQVAAAFAAVPAAQFYLHPPQVWSAAENLAHLIKSVRIATLAYRLPARMSGLVWGTASRSRSYAELLAAYRAKLQRGAEAPAAFLPELGEPPTDPAAGQRVLLEQWMQSMSKLLKTLDGWQEADLDKAQVPHPLLGKLTLRELLFFTRYHNLHHVNDMQRLLGLPEVAYE